MYTQENQEPETKPGIGEVAVDFEDLEWRTLAAILVEPCPDTQRSET